MSSVIISSGPPALFGFSVSIASFNSSSVNSPSSCAVSWRGGGVVVIALGLGFQCCVAKYFAQSLGNEARRDPFSSPRLLNLGMNVRLRFFIAGQFCWCPVKVRSCSCILSFLSFLTWWRNCAVSCRLSSGFPWLRASSLSLSSTMVVSLRYGFLMSGGLVPRVAIAISVMVFWMVSQVSGFLSVCGCTLLSVLWCTSFCDGSCLLALGEYQNASVRLRRH